MNSANNWDSLTPKAPAMNTGFPYPYQIPQAFQPNGAQQETEKALAMKAYITGKNILPSEIDAMADAKAAGVDVIKLLHEATPKDERDQRIDKLSEEMAEIKNALKAIIDKPQIRNGAGGNK